MKEFIKDILSEILSRKEDKDNSYIAYSIVGIVVIIALCYAITVLN